MSAETHGRGKPRAAVAGEQWYEIENLDGSHGWIRGVDLLQLPAPVKVLSIAWRV